MAQKQAKEITVIVIDPRQREVYPLVIRDDFRDGRRIVGGSIEAVVDFGSHTVIYANENGRFIKPLLWWTLRDHPVLLTGPAFVVKVDRFHHWHTPNTSAERIKNIIEFLDEDEARVKHEEHQNHRRTMMTAKIAALAKERGVSVEEARKSVIFIESKFPE